MTAIMHGQGQGPSQLQNLASEEAEKLALGIGSDPDPYARERPLDRTNRMSRSFERASYMEINTKIAPVSSLGRVDVTDAWGMGWAMDSPYDPSIAYSSNPTKMASRQSVFFNQPGNNNGKNPPQGLTYNHPALANSSPAFSGISQISGVGSGGMVWSEASSSSSATSIASYNVSQEQAQINRRRSVSFQSDLTGTPASGRKSPSSQSWHERPRSEMNGNGGRARTANNIPSLLGNPSSRARNTGGGPQSPGIDSDTLSIKSSRSRLTTTYEDPSLPPIPIDPKILAKREKRASRAAGGMMGLSSSASATSFQNQLRPANNRKSTDAASLNSFSSSSKRRSTFGWLSRGSSSDEQSNASSPGTLSPPTLPSIRSSSPAPSSRSSSPARGKPQAALSVPPVPPLPQQPTTTRQSSATSITSSTGNAASKGLGSGNSSSVNFSAYSPSHLSVQLPPTGPASNSSAPVTPVAITPSTSFTSSPLSQLPTNSPHKIPSATPPSKPLTNGVDNSGKSGKSGKSVFATPPTTQQTPRVGSITSSVSSPGLSRISAKPMPSFNDGPPSASRFTEMRGAEGTSNGQTDTALTLAPAAIIKSSPSSPADLGGILTRKENGIRHSPGSYPQQQYSQHGQRHQSRQPSPQGLVPIQAQSQPQPQVQTQTQTETQAQSQAPDGPPRPYIPPNAASLSSFPARPPPADKPAALPSLGLESLHLSKKNSVASFGPDQIPLPASRASSAGPSTPASFVARNPMEFVNVPPRSSSSPMPPNAATDVCSGQSETAAQSHFHPGGLPAGAAAPLYPDALHQQIHRNLDHNGLPVPVAPHGISNGPNQNPGQLRPHASYPHLSRNVTPRASADTVATPKFAPAKQANASVPPRGGTPTASTKKDSKSGFSLFRRNRSKTSGEADRPKKLSLDQQQQQQQQRVPSGAHNHNNQRRDTPGSNTPSSAQQTPLPTPQLSFSSSTTSTIATMPDQNADGFYAGFTSKRPPFAEKSSSGGSSRHTAIPQQKKAKEEGRFFGGMFGKKKSSQAPRMPLE